MRTLRPAELCRALLRALEASEGRRSRRRRDTTPDAIGLGIKRALLEAAVADDPAPEAFDAWLLEHCLSAGDDVSVGAVRMIAVDVLAEWRLAAALPDFREWLHRGAPSDDARVEGDAEPSERLTPRDGPARPSESAAARSRDEPR